MRHILSLFVTVFVFSLSTQAQPNNQNYNKIGVTGGYLFSNIETNDLPISSANGLTFGLETRGSYSRDLDFIYAISFYDAKVDIQTFQQVADPEVEEIVNMSQQSVQLHFLASYNIIKHHLSVEAGPAVAIQGKFKPENSSQEDNRIAGYTLATVGNLRELSTIDFRLVGSVSFGIEPFRLSVMYIRGMTNSLNALNGTLPEFDDLKGNNSFLGLRGTIYF